MARVVLVEAAPWNPATGVATAIRLAGLGRRHYTHKGQVDWLAGVVTLPKVTTEIGFAQGGVTGGAVPQAAAIGFSPSRRDTRARLARLMWAGAPVVVSVGDDEAADAGWTVVLAGTIAGYAIANGSFTFTMSDMAGRLAKPLAADVFAGTGGIEGPAEATGRAKRRSWGQVFNVEGRILDAASAIYEFGDPARPLQGFVAVKDRGRAGPTTTVAWAGSIAATLDALKAAAAPDGGAAIAPSIACVKWWTSQPAPAPLTADLLGEVGTGYVETVPEIAARIVEAAAGPAVVGIEALVALRPHAAGIHVDGAETAAAVLDRLLLGASLSWSIDPAGATRLLPIGFTEPAARLRAHAIEREAVFAPITRVEVGYRRNHRQHSDAEISAAVRSDSIVMPDGSSVDAAIAGAGQTAVWKQVTGIGRPTDYADVTALNTAAAIIGQGSGATANSLAGLNAGEGAKLGGIAAGASSDTVVTATYDAPLVVGNSIAKTTTSTGYNVNGDGAATSGIGNAIANSIRVVAQQNVVGMEAQISLGGGINYRVADQLIGIRTLSDRSARVFRGGTEVATLVPPGGCDGNTVYSLDYSGAQITCAVLGGGSYSIPAAPGATFIPNFHMATLGAGYRNIVVSAGNRAPRLANFAFDEGGAMLTDTIVKTVLGTAAAIAGQGAFATVNSAAYGSSLLTGFGALAPLASLALGGQYLLRADGATRLTDGTVVTAQGTAAAIAGQGAFATLSSAAYGSSLLTGFGALAPLASLALGGQYLLRGDGTTRLTDGTVVTAQGTAAAIAGQGAFATVSSAAYGSSLLTGFGALAPLASLALGGQYLLRSDGTTRLTDGTVVTAQGTAAAIVGQGSGATANNLAALNASEGAKLGGISPGATSDIVLLSFRESVATVNGNTVTKPGSTNAFDCGVYCNYSLPAPCKFAANSYFGTEMSVRLTNGFASSNDGAGYQLRVEADNKIYAYVDGSKDGGAIADFGSNSALEISIDNVNIFLSISGSVVRTYPAPLNAVWTAFMFIKTPGGTIFSAKFIPWVERNFVNMGGATRPENNATVGAIFGVNAREAAGGAVATLSSFKTALGVASAIAGQGSLATANQASWATQVTGIPQFLADTVQRPGYDMPAVRSDYVINTGAGVALAARWPEEGGANRTETRAAAAIAGQGTLATRNDVAYASMIAGLPLALQPASLRDDGRIDADKVSTTNRTLLQYFPEDVRSNRTEMRSAAAIAGQGVLATLNQVQLNTATIRLADGTTIVTENLIVTTQGVAAAIAGQGSLATRNGVGTGEIGANAITAPMYAIIENGGSMGSYPQGSWTDFDTATGGGSVGSGGGGGGAGGGGGGIAPNQNLQ